MRHSHDATEPTDILGSRAPASSLQLSWDIPDAVVEAPPRTKQRGEPLLPGDARKRTPKAKKAKGPLITVGRQPLAPENGDIEGRPEG